MNYRKNDEKNSKNKIKSCEKEIIAKLVVMNVKKFVLKVLNLCFVIYDLRFKRCSCPFGTIIWDVHLGRCHENLL